MPSVNPPYPSLALVMSSNTGNSADTSRLPAYRASHFERYHPDSRAHPSHHGNHMTTVDYRYRDPPIFQPQRRSSFALPAIIIEDCDIKIEAESNDAEEVVDRRNRINLKTLSDYVFAFAVAVQRKCRRAIAVKRMEDELQFDFLN
ncbi:hypothetical protein HETIRDRAFT_114852 [Heterobasidion irregulare TC 32-1]|uniref:Uncharacterized protein n=1 Tax=Heterobasidion irregulare (strain TC 32-1) TaxID=747525 RepID=W4KK58_HETIT|nr:uncharacterized protein HETIRDRAFT_114852 [Heterobasidion irregulare TC 32-1]ETW86248.1 hypothetical protein HETIRDRAFT_114852 [Heterobasidion irregulare TC 32-1]